MDFPTSAQAICKHGGEEGQWLPNGKASWDSDRYRLRLSLPLSGLSVKTTKKSHCVETGHHRDLPAYLSYKTNIYQTQNIRLLSSFITSNKRTRTTTNLITFNLLLIQSKIICFMQSEYKKINKQCIVTQCTLCFSIGSFNGDKWAVYQLTFYLYRVFSKLHLKATWMTKLIWSLMVVSLRSSRGVWMIWLLWKHTYTLNKQYVKVQKCNANIWN